MSGAPRSWRSVRQGVAALLLAAACLLGSAAGQSPQPSLPSPSGPASTQTPGSSASPSPPAAPSEIPSPAVSPTGPADVASVELNGIELLRIHGAGELNARERARVLTDRLESALEHASEPPDVTVGMVDVNPVLQCAAVHLMTVTDQDAAREGLPKSIVAVNYRTRLERGLRRVWQERSGLHLADAARWVTVVVLVGVLLHLLARWAARKYLNSPGWLAASFIWLGAGTLILLAFPQTRAAGHELSSWIVGPLLRVMGTAVAAFLAWHAGGALLDRYFAAVLSLHGEGEIGGRAPRRIHALQQTARVVLNAIIAVFVLTGLLAVFNIKAQTLLASAGIIGVALGVAAQDVLRDVVAGLSILLEDQFGVGDYIQTSTASGEVVGFTLRATRLRNVDGSLITVPNSVIRIVENQSNEWSQADVQVRVRPGTRNVERAQEVMAQVGKEMREENEAVLEVPQVLGVERVSPSAVTLRMLVRTAPSRQWGVRRDALSRLAREFEREGIEVPISHWKSQG